MKTIKEIDLLDDIDLPEFKTTNEILQYIKRVLQLRPWHSKEVVISEIKNL